MLTAANDLDAGQAEIVLDRARLVRLCRQLTGDPDIAEDLAQEALLIAWRNAHKLYSAEVRWPWLAGIARNLCRHWTRRRGREWRFAQLGADEEQPAVDDVPADESGIELDLERDELARLLDRALALLPPDTRTALVQHYIEEAPQAEIAARLGVSADAVEGRLRRGRLTLKRVLTTQFSDDAVAYGLVSPAQAGWQATRLWCPGCGRCRLDGTFRPDAGELDLRCPGCSLPGGYYIASRLGDGFRGIRTYRPAVQRVLAVIHDLYRVRLVDGVVPCWSCGELVPIRRGAPPWVRPDTPPWAPPGGAWSNCIYLWCPRCGAYDGETWHSLTWSLPAARRFWRDHPRLRFLPEREIEVDGSPAMVTGFESLTGSARLEVVTLRDSLRVVRLNGAPPGWQLAPDGVE